ncbi:DUF1643 domain-containing protein [Saccharothrix hoggarensis]|uniref:DUF1643 domain-containing protein n=1 Tax=Saccharothrix hoggarensis TaxID=913853 RepID=A0ABW3QN36_9PSEU
MSTRPEAPRDPQPSGNAVFSSCAKADRAGHDRAACQVCDTYRYTLDRAWGDGPIVGWLMLNPSTATSTADDPTIRRCTGFTAAWGYERFTVRNLFALCATKPEALKVHLDPVGPDNDDHLCDLVHADIVVCAWGNHGRIDGRARQVVEMLADLHVDLVHLGLTGLHQPKHPLFTLGTLRPQPLDVAKFLRRRGR